MNQDNGLKIIFLDVDGVLNCSSTTDRCGRYIGIESSKVGLLKQIVDATKAKIVLVSTWKECWYKEPCFKGEQDYLADYLDKKLSQQGLKIADKTDDGLSLKRGSGILDYLSNLKELGLEVEKFIIIDDEPFDYLSSKLTSHLIRTKYEKGLQENHVRMAIEKLC